MKTIDFSYFIERYNAGEMNEAEREWFQKELDGNEKLRNEVDLRKETDDILKNQDIIKLRNKLADIQNKREVTVPENGSGKLINMKYAAVVAGIVLIGSLILLPDRKMNSDEIMNRYYKAYEAMAPSRSGQSEINRDFSTAIDFYNVHDYRNAAKYFSKVLGSEQKDMYSTFLYGVSKFEVKDYPEAKQSFAKVINDKTSLYTEDARWYLALCYVKTEENNLAIEQLNIIRESTSIHRTEAKKILRKLK
jgi:TolA-binding protein